MSVTQHSQQLQEMGFISRTGTFPGPVAEGHRAQLVVGISMLMIPGVSDCHVGPEYLRESHCPNTGLQSCVDGRTQLASNLQHSVYVCLMQRSAVLLSVWLSYEPHN